MMLLKRYGKHPLIISDTAIYPMHYVVMDALVVHFSDPFIISSLTLHILFNINLPFAFQDLMNALSYVTNHKP